MLINFVLANDYIRERHQKQLCKKTVNTQKKKEVKTMFPLRIELRTFRVLSGCVTTTPRKQLSVTRYKNIIPKRYPLMGHNLSYPPRDYVDTFCIR